MSVQAKQASYEVGPWTFPIPGNEIIHADGHKLKLEDKIALLLETLCEMRGEIVSKDQLIEHVWQGRELSEQTIPVAISKLRKALGDDINNPLMLATIPRQGYQLLSDPREKKHARQVLSRSTVAQFAAVFLLGLSAVYFWLWSGPPTSEPFDRIQFANSEKPGVIVTINDVRVADGNNDKIPLAIAVSEMSSYYLSQVSDILVIRHWWNLDAPDPTGGIFTRYGPATPVYSLKGTLIEDGETEVVSFSLTNPKNDEVIWSGMHSVDNGSTGLFPLFEGMLNRLQVATTSASNAPDETVSYWRARYFMQLSNPSAATIAATELMSLLETGDNSPASIASAKALTTRWKDNADIAKQIALLNTRISQIVDEQDPAQNHFALVDEASSLLFGSSDAKSAIELLEAALDQAPGDHYALSLLAEAKVLNGDLPAAIAAYDKAFRLAPYAKAYETRLIELKEQL